MKHLLITLFFTSSLCLHLNACDVLAQAIMASDVMRVKELVKDISGSTCKEFISLADDMVMKRHGEYLAHKIIPPFSAKTVITGIAGLALAWASIYFARSPSPDFLSFNDPLPDNTVEPIIEMCASSVGKAIDSEIKNGVITRLNKMYNTLEKERIVATRIARICLAAGIGLLALTRLFIYKDKKALHQLYVNAIEIRHMLNMKSKQELQQ